MSTSCFTQEDPDMDYLSASNIECLDESILKVAKMSFPEKKNDSHGVERNRLISRRKAR